MPGQQPPAGLEDFINAPSGGQMVAANTGAPAGLDEFVEPEMKQEKFGTLPQQALTGLESLASGATLGASEYLEPKFLPTSYENIQARKEANPATNIAGQVVGAGGMLALTGGVGAPAEAALLARGAAPLAAAGIGYAAEGAALAAGQAAVDTMLLDKELTAQQIAGDIGVGTLLGGGLGIIGKSIALKLGKGAAEAGAAEPAVSNNVHDAIRGAQEEVAGGSPLLKEGAIFDPPMGVKAQSLEEIEKAMKDLKYMGPETGIETELPTKKILQGISERINPELPLPILDAQLSSLDSQDARNIWNIARESDTKAGKIIRDLETAQKSQLVNKLENKINEIGGEAKVTSDAVKAGNRASEIFTNQYENEQARLKPILKFLHEADINRGENTVNHLPGLVRKWATDLPSVAEAFDGLYGTNPNEIKLRPYKTSMGLSKSAYGAIKEAVESIESRASQSFQELWNIRKNLDQNINIMEKGEGPGQIKRLRASMLDYMQDQLENAGHSLMNLNTETGELTPSSVRQIFKDYAINQSRREIIEKAFGASVGSPEFSELSRVKPELIIDKIFKDTASVKAAKSMLDPKEFNELLANHLAEQKALATDKGVFSSNKFASQIKRNQDALNAAFEGNDLRKLEQIKDYVDAMRIMPDAPSINPSGTAKTLMGILKGHSLPEIAGNLKKYLADAVHEKQEIKKVNAMLSGKQAEISGLEAIQKQAEKTTKKIGNAAEAIFTSGKMPGVAIAASLRAYHENYDKNVKQVKEFAYNPQHQSDMMASSTKELQEIAPELTQSLHNTANNAVQFLASKIPGPTVTLPLSPKFEPTDAQKTKFNMYYRAVNEPISVMGDIKNGMLTSESIEALQAVHPRLLGQMRKSLMEEFDHEKAHELDYPTKMGLAKFMGEPLDVHMMPQTLVSYQADFAQPTRGQSNAKPTLGGLKELGKDERVATRTQNNEEA